MYHDREIEMCSFNNKTHEVMLQWEEVRSTLTLRSCVKGCLGPGQGPEATAVALNPGFLITGPPRLRCRPLTLRCSDEALNFGHDANLVCIF